MTVGFSRLHAEASPSLSLDARTLVTYISNRAAARTNTRRPWRQPDPTARSLPSVGSRGVDPDVARAGVAVSLALSYERRHNPVCPFDRGC
jgi:hypothetical protein